MKVILYLAQTLNGYIAKPDDSTPWSKQEFAQFHKTVKKMKNIVLGRRTYLLMRETSSFKKCGNPFVVVLTRSSKHAEHKNTVFVKSPDEALRVLKAKGFKEVLLGGGSNLNSSFMERGLVNEMHLDMEPQIFGSGKPLFKEGEFEGSLKLIKINKISKDLLQLRYRVTNS